MLPAQAARPLAEAVLELLRWSSFITIIIIIIVIIIINYCYCYDYYDYYYPRFLLSPWGIRNPKVRTGGSSKAMGLGKVGALKIPRGWQRLTLVFS